MKFTFFYERQRLKTRIPNHPLRVVLLSLRSIGVELDNNNQHYLLFSKYVSESLIKHI